MGDTEVVFITRFHNLEGALISERKKNFFKLLQDKSLLPNEDQLNMVLKDLRPKTYLESLLRIDMLIYFKKTTELLEILKEGNEVFISKVIKQPWFFKEAFKEINADKFVNEFLPCTSFAIRMKILKRLSHTVNETQMDELFKCVLKRYGLYVATPILHRCSSMKILEVLADNEIRLRSSQVTKLFDRDPNLFKSYLTHYENITQSPYKEKYVFKHIALKDPQFLLELKRENKLNTKPFGHRLSKKIINLIKYDVMKDVTSYMPLLKANVIVRMLQGNFKKVYFDLFPRKLDEIDINNLCNKLLQFYPKNQRWDLFVQTFSQVFDNQTVTDNLSYLSRPILQMCDDKEIKKQWAKIQYNGKNDDSFLKYYEPAHLLPLIKERMNVCASNYDRATLLNIMIDSCKEYKDLTAFEKVLEYACLRFRNTDRQSVLSHIRYHGFPLQDLSENHWKYINELIEVARIKKEYNHYQHYEFTTKYLEFLFKNGKPFRKELTLFIEDTIRSRDKFWPQINNGAIEKEILIQILNIMPDKVREECKDYKTIYQQLTLDVFNFSLLDCNAKYCIRLGDFPHLMTFIKSILDKTDNFDDIQCQIISNIVHYNLRFPQNTLMIERTRLREIILTVSKNHQEFSFKDLLEFMLMNRNRSELENEMLELYFGEIADKHVSHTISFWFLRNEPEVLVPYVKKIATINDLRVFTYTKYRKRRALYNHISYLKEIKLCSHLNIDVAFIDFLKERLRDPEYESKGDIMSYLLVLLSTDDFIKIVTEYFLPKKIKLDLQDEDMKKSYKSQCEVAKILKGVSEPFKMLPIVTKFCIGDYLQSALPSLYSVCYRSPENRLPLYMDILSKRAVSVRKHSVFLSSLLLDYNYAVNQLKTAERSNVSSQKHVFSATQKYFLRNQSKDLLDLLISNMSTIDKNDTETLNSLSSIKVPKKFQVLYIEECWGFFESVRLEVMIEDYLRSLLLKILTATDIIVSLSSQFCKHVISSYFEKKVDDLLNMESFVCRLLKDRKLEQKENFDIVFKIISSFKADNQSVAITRFFNKFYAVATSEEFDPHFVRLFSTYWERCFTPVEMFNEYVLLKLLRMKYDSPLVENYAKNVAAFMDLLILEYGLYVCNRFNSLLRRLLTSVFVEKKDKYLFYHYFLKCNLARESSILVLDIMDKVYEDCAKDSQQDKEIFQIYCDILQILKEVQVPIVQVYYKSYVREI